MIPQNTVDIIKGYVLRKGPTKTFRMRYTDDFIYERRHRPMPCSTSLGPQVKEKKTTNSAA